MKRPHDGKTLQERRTELEKYVRERKERARAILQEKKKPENSLKTHSA